MSRRGSKAPDTDAGIPGEVRLDIWLWRARFHKTRTLAAEAISGKGVRVDRAGMVRKLDKPGATVAVGDVLSFRQGGRVLTVEVLDLGERRGPSVEARGLYKDLTHEM